MTVERRNMAKKTASEKADKIEKPDKGKAITLLLLKEKIGSKSAGAYKKVRNNITIDLNILLDFFILIIF